MVQKDKLKTEALRSRECSILEAGEMKHREKSERLETRKGSEQPLLV